MKLFKWWRIFAHRHWITLSFNGKKIRLCSRCSGTVVGYSLLKFVFVQGLKIVNSLLLHHQLFLCILFSFPTILDWITQTWDWRESTNNLRLATGFFLGISAALFSQIPLPQIVRRILYTSIIIGVFGIGFLGRKIKTSN